MSTLSLASPVGLLRGSLCHRLRLVVFVTVPGCRGLRLRVVIVFTCRVRVSVECASEVVLSTTLSTFGSEPMLSIETMETTESLSRSPKLPFFLGILTTQPGVSI